jgi:anti-sigma B factor antagonist
MTDHPSNHHGGSDWDSAWFRVDPRSNCVVVIAGGEVDMHSSVGLDRALKTATLFSPCVIVDLSAVTFVDSTALGVLIGARRRAQSEGGRVILVHPPSLVRRLLAGTQLQQSFAVFETLDDALTTVA